MPRPSTVRFPGETSRYRAARNRLLAAERDLRKSMEHVAKRRRTLPPGGKVAEDYSFRLMTMTRYSGWRSVRGVAFH